MIHIPNADFTFVSLYSPLLRGSCCGLVCGNDACGDDDLICLSGGDEVEESLGSTGQLTLGDQQEGTLDGVTAVLDGLVGGSNAADLQSLDGVLDSGNGSVADGTGITSHSGQNVAVRGQLLTVLACILNTDDLLETGTGAGGSVTADADDLSVDAADLGPIGDLATVDSSNLLDGQILDGVLGIDDYYSGSR